MIDPEARATGPASMTARIVEIAKRRRLKGSQLARMSGLPTSTISKFLAGKVGLSGRSLEKLATALGLELVERMPPKHSRGRVLPRRKFSKPV